MSTETGNSSTGIRARFRRTESGIVVEARSSGFTSRALAPMARVGRTPVVGVVADAGRLTGLLLGTPNDGDELFVRFPPEPEVATGVRFRRRPQAVA